MSDGDQRPDDRPLQGRDVLPEGYRTCYVCGPDNPSGLQLLDVRREGDVVTATLNPTPLHQGFPGALHGGVAAAALDEVMGYACRLLMNTWAATATLELRYRRPLTTDESLIVEAGVEQDSSTRRMRTWGRLRQKSGEIAVEAKAVFVAIKPRAAFSSPA